MAKSAISGQNPHIGIGAESGYRYPLYRGELVPIPLVGLQVPIHQRGIGTGTEQGGTSVGASSNLVFVTLALLSLVYVHRLFRDPNKGLMGVHIRVYERENVPFTSPQRYSFSTINCSNTKNGEFVFD